MRLCTLYHVEAEPSHCDDPRVERLKLAPHPANWFHILKAIPHRCEPGFKRSVIARFNVYLFYHRQRTSRAVTPRVSLYGFGNSGGSTYKYFRFGRSRMHRDHNLDTERMFAEGVAKTASGGRGGGAAGPSWPPLIMCGSRATSGCGIDGGDGGPKKVTPLDRAVAAAEGARAGNGTA